MKVFPLTARETQNCPPHHWYIPIEDKGRDGIGHCVKPGCKAVKDFSGNGNGHKAGGFQGSYRKLMRLRCSKGGQKNRGKVHKPHLEFS